MTGLDCLREEMQRRGLSITQIEGKVAPVVLDILANSGTKYTEMWNEEQGQTRKLKQLKNDIRSSENRLEYLKKCIEKLSRDKETATKHREHCEDYIEEFQKSLSECESQSGRDSMRAAQMFVNSVTVDTKYDNTAFIIGLAAILSNGGINAINELKKINKKLPEINIDYWFNIDEPKRI